ncbi:glutathione S-transferase N-terminal domain-containing protein [Cupriavidus sp. 2TAF22]|uniref:glutathione S-transferase N-terminal domain-containing protein n=1 Tax=unclassified Cupriavidus TaxID=2640874 RepID=UPI003F90298D
MTMMKLLYSPGSPYARKVRIVLREKGLIDSVEEAVVNPHDNGAEFLSLNPLAKVPTLQIGSDSLFDSPLICEYLDGLSGVGPLIPREPESRISVLWLQALADGMMDAAVASVLEARRSDTEPSRHWLLRWENAIRRSLAALSTTMLPSQMSLGGIAVACALDYVSFRCPAIRWRDEYPELAAWCDLYVDRPSFAETTPPRS